MKGTLTLRADYLLQYAVGQVRKCCKVKERKILHGKTVMNNQETAAHIRALIQKGEPAMVCRFGSVEAGAVDAHLRRRLGLQKKYTPEISRAMCNNAGFFAPKGQMEPMLDRFGEEMLAACGHIDLIGVWNSCEPYILKHYAPKEAAYCRLGGLSPKSAYPDQWPSALAGKKVLVVHPFDVSIRNQYARKDLVFPNGFLPDFQLHTVKAVQTAAGEADPRFETWFDALDYMKAEMDKIDYDVAIIGCGAYGFLLAQHAKLRGKIGIHIGGSTQMLFGIMGKRWENTKKHAVNEYWVHPLEEETPKKASAVEGGCYW